MRINVVCDVTSFGILGPAAKFWCSTGLGRPGTGEGRRRGRIRGYMRALCICTHLRCKLCLPKILCFIQYEICLFYQEYQLVEKRKKHESWTAYQAYNNILMIYYFLIITLFSVSSSEQFIQRVQVTNSLVLTVSVLISQSDVMSLWIVLQDQTKKCAVSWSC